jgi:hypothetical protein
VAIGVMHPRRAALLPRGAALILASLGFAASSGAVSPDRMFWNDFEAPIDAPEATWTWVDVPQSQCADGSATGFGINPSALSDRVLIYLAGGGACWNYLTCYSFGTASNLDGYGAADFAVDVAALDTAGQFFDRNDSANPFRDYSYVAIPYCTGDVFAGDNVVDLSFLGSKITTHFVGHRNMAAFLKRLAATFPNAGRVILSGSSAGGFGATLNWWQAQNAFPQVRVDLINDSGAVMPEDVLADPNTTEQTQRQNWNLAATLPPGCTACANAFDVILAFYADVFPDNRGALLSYNPDSVIRLFYSLSESQFSAGLAELEAQQFDPTLNLRYFEAVGPDHVLWTHPDDVVVGSTTVREFITKMVEDDATWDSVTPP